jgi:hypothetical protein
MICDWRSRFSTYARRPLMLVVLLMLGAILMLGAVLMLRDWTGARGLIRS